MGLLTGKASRGPEPQLAAAYSAQGDHVKAQSPSLVYIRSQCGVLLDPFGALLSRLSCAVLFGAGLNDSNPFR